jgi:hypothetical protein
MPWVTREMLEHQARVVVASYGENMPALTKTEHAEREVAIRKVRSGGALLAAGCCPSVTIVDFGLPTQHVVYCEAEQPEGVYAHRGFHRGLAGVEVPGWRTAPVQWQWPS